MLSDICDYNLIIPPPQLPASGDREKEVGKGTAAPLIIVSLPAGDLRVARKQEWLVKGHWLPP
jgi:hypothetical protein